MKWPKFLWAHKTTPRFSTGKRPFSLSFRTKAVIPTELAFATNCTTIVNFGYKFDLLIYDQYMK